MEWKPAGDVRFRRPLAKVRLLVLLSFFAGLSQTLLAATPSVEGQWGPRIYFTTVPISAAVLPNGKLLIFSSWDRYAFQSGTGARNKTYSNLYDPATGQVTEFLVTQTNHDMFCPGTALLEDGRLLVNGGGPRVTTTSIYDFSGNQSVRGASMSRRRWYNASTTLPGGGVFTLGGIPDDGVGELWTSGAGWSVLAGAPVTPMTVDAGSYMPRSEQHPKVLVAPNGKLFAAGPTPNMQWYDTASGGSVRFAGRRGDDIYAQNNVTVLFDVGKILTAGGSPRYDGGSGHPPASANAYVIDINSAVSTRKIASMQYRRSYANGVILPDGRVLVVGGKGDGKVFSDAAAVFVPEMFDPDTETWTPMARQATPRTYHSTALLLPDGRVFSGGGGLCGNCSVNHADGEIYSPPYLFQGPRPVIQGAPTVVGYNAPFSIATTGDVARFTFVRLSSTTHTVNTDQRFLPLASVPNGGDSFTVTSPLNANIAPPGYYMLFALNATGVPSVSKIMKLSTALGQVPALAATITVNTNIPDIAADGTCSLIEAIENANADNAGTHTDCAFGSLADVIVLPPNSIHKLTAVNNTSFGPTGLPVINSTITIVGNGSTITRETLAPDFRILAVGSGGDLTLQETRVSGGRATGSSFDPQRGGGLLNKGSLSLVGSTVFANLALAEGGGVNNGSFVTLRLINSTISGNSATIGGGLSNSQGTVTMMNSTVSGNSASADGGGVSSGGGSLTLTNSTVSGNLAGQDGGGLSTNGTATITTSTVSGNRASQNGGGVYHDGGTLTLHETLISGNTAASHGPELSTTRGTVNANRFNLFGFGGDAGVTPSFSPGVTDLVPGEPLTAILDTALRNNGGPTTTHALTAGSPAIDAAGTCFPQTDQRGIPRPRGVDTDGDGLPDCDIGAFEINAAFPPSPPPPPPLPDGGDVVVTNPARPIPCAGSACNVRVDCNLAENSGTQCVNRIEIFVRAAAVRLSGDGLAKVQRPIRFAFGAAKIPSAQTAKVKLKITKKGKGIVKRKRGKTLKGVLEIRNAAGIAVSSTPIRIRLR